MRISDAKRMERLAEWKALIDSQRSSGMSIRAWCECNDLTEQQYYYRLRHVREFVLEHMDSAENVQLVKLPAFSTSQYGLANTASSKFNLKYHSVEIELPSETSMTKLAELVRALVQ